MTTAAAVLDFLEKNYLAVNGYCEAEPSFLITDFGLSIPFSGRFSLITKAATLYQKRLRSRESNDRNAHKIGVIGGVSGIGKSRALIEIATAVRTWKKDDEWSVEIVISYNNGNPTHRDRRLDGDVSVDWAHPALALRILYFAFVARKGVNIAFEDFVDKFPRDLLKVVTPRIAIEVITLYQKARFNNRNGVIFLALDEVNYLLDSDYKGEESKRAFLKETFVALGSAMFQSATFVFTVIAGTTVLPVSTVFAQSGLTMEYFPISLLSNEDCETLMDTMSELDSRWSDWRHCRAFRILLADFASMPRGAENLLMLARDELDKETKLIDIDYQFLMTQLTATMSSSSDQLNRLALTIVSDVLLERPVQREELVRKENLAEGCSDFRYGDLEASGAITLATADDTQLFVELPFARFRTLVKRMDGSDPLTKALREVCDLVRSDRSFGGLCWQNFEDFHCQFEAIREMLLARSLGELTTCSAHEFYCVDPSTLSPAHVNFDFKLRRICSIEMSPWQFPSDDWIPEEDGVERMSYVRNASGATFDSFTVRETTDGARMLLCGQQKLYLSKKVTRKMIIDEVEKVKRALSEKMPFRLVIFASRVSPDAVIDLPAECLVVTGSAWTKFYSKLFVARARLSFDSLTVKVNINTATEAELLTVDRVGKATAKDIVRCRPHSSWGRVRTVIPRLPDDLEEFFEF